MSVTLSNLTISRVSAGSSGSTPAASDPYWSSVSLLTGTTGTNTQNNNAFLDSSTNNFTVTRIGSTTQGSFTPFAVANGASYSTATNGASAYFDGVGDFLTIANSSALNILSGDFTIETWFYPTSSSGIKTLIAQWQQTAGAGGYAVFQNGTTIQFAFGAITDAGVSLSSSTAITINTWNHIAIVRNGSNFTMWLNGTSVATTTSAATQAAIAVPTSLGQYYNSSGVLGATGTVDLVGYLSSTRIVKGTAVYTAAFTPSTTPLTAITNTSLLLNYTNAGIYDAAAENNMFTLGDAQVSTTEKKFGNSSMLFSNVGDYVTMPGGSQFGFGTGDFTIEFWTFLNGTRFEATWIDFRTQTVQNAPLILSNAGTLTYWVNGSARITSSMFGTGEWTHVAVSRASGSTKMFVNGVQVDSTFTDSTDYVIPTSGPIVGEGLSHASGTSLNGYMQDIRITKGVDRYTSNFTVPTEPFPTN